MTADIAVARDGSGVSPADTEVVDAATHRRIEDFLYLEAELLDDRRYNDWLELLADDLHYVMPLRVTRESQAEWELAPTGRIFDDTRDTIGIRIARLNTEYAWAEQPPSRTRHYVTNVRARATGTTGEHDVRSNVLVYRSRGDDPRFDLFSAARRDRLRESDRGLQLVTRYVALDQSAVGAHNLSIFF